MTTIKERLSSLEAKVVFLTEATKVANQKHDDILKSQYALRSELHEAIESPMRNLVKIINDNEKRITILEKYRNVASWCVGAFITGAVAKWVSLW
jgi:hypothetical protein